MNKTIEILIGKSVDNKEDIIQNFSENSHLLIAGSTGSGKSNFLLSVIGSLMKKFSSKELQFILADPKRVEFLRFKNSPYLKRSIIITTKEALEASKFLEEEMERRYEDFRREEVKNIIRYNEKAEKKMPYIFFIADEISDFMVDKTDGANRKIENNLVQLTQMSRPVGIHMLFATSRPCEEVIPISLLANVPMRLAFQMAVEDDSKFFLNRSGAERLLGKGDGLYFGPVGKNPIRVQAPLISEEEMRII